jgi:hypothetical protein
MAFSAIQNILASKGVVQIKTVQSSAKMSSSTVIPLDNTRPQITEGVEYFNLSITPTKTGNTLAIYCCMPQVAGNGTDLPSMAIFRSDQNDALIATSGVVNSAGSGFYVQKYFACTTAAGTTSPLTISLRFGPNAGGPVYMNADDNNDQYFNGAWIVCMYVVEIEA